MKKLIVSTLFLSALAGCAALPMPSGTGPVAGNPPATGCHAASKAEISALFDRWNSSLKTGDPKKVVANYAQDSILLPTLSNKPRLSAAEKEDYFGHFLAKGPVGEIDLRHIEIDCNTAVDSGLYTFTFNDGSKANARYTYTYKWEGTAWLITSHHSSLMPEKSAAH